MSLPAEIILKRALKQTGEQMSPESLNPQEITIGRRIYATAVNEKPHGYAIRIAEDYLHTALASSPDSLALIISDHHLNVDTRRKKRGAQGSVIDRVMEIEETDDLYDNPRIAIGEAGIQHDRNINLIVLVEPKDTHLILLLSTAYPEAVILTVRSSENYSEPDVLTDDMKHAVKYAVDNGYFPEGTSFSTMLYIFYHQHETGGEYLSLREIAQRLGQDTTNQHGEYLIRTWLEECHIGFNRDTSPGHQRQTEALAQKRRQQAIQVLESRYGMPYPQVLAQHSATALAKELPGIGMTTIRSLMGESNIDTHGIITEQNRSLAQAAREAASHKSIDMHKNAVVTALAQAAPQLTQEFGLELVEMLQDRFLHEMKYTEIAELHHMPVSTVKSRVHALIERAEQIAPALALLQSINIDDDTRAKVLQAL